MWRRIFEMARPEYLTPTMAAERSGRSRATIYRWVNRGWLDGYEGDGGTLVVRSDDLDQLVAWLDSDAEEEEINGL